MWFLEDNKVSYMDDSATSRIADNIREKLGIYLLQKDIITRSLVFILNLLAGRKSQCPHHITLERL